MRQFRLAAIVAVLGLIAFSFSRFPSPDLEYSGSTALHAQSLAAQGAVSGIVVDVNGAPIAGALVELVSNQVVLQSVFSSSLGEFGFHGVAAGAYELRTALAGFFTTTRPVTVGTAEVRGLRIVLRVGALEETVTISGSAPAQAAGAAAARADAGVYPKPAVPVTSSMRMAESPAVIRQPEFNREGYSRIDDNPFRRVTEEPVSTFSTDVDTASYANVRRFLNNGQLPPPDAVRIEELINYFRYSYPEAGGDAPLSMTTEVAPAPWNPRHQLALVGLRARAQSERAPRRNLVFLLDVSGSMASPDKLPLVQSAMRMLAETLTADDRVAIVVYAGASGLVLPSTPGDRRLEIDRAIANLAAGGSTNGAAGIQLAYDTAAANFVRNGVNRVILATDGDFNVGITNQGDLTRLIETERERGIFLSVLGVGTGNLQDHTMEMLADRGNGNYSYLDSLHEARRVLVAEAGSTLVTVAKDVKIQIEFNPATVAAYRLVGYENRMLAREDFNNDLRDAGDLGAGHTVTALYELIPVGEAVPGVAVDPLIYQRQQPAASRSDDLMTLKVRYKEPDSATSELMTVPVRSSRPRLTANIGFAAAVAEFGMLLRSSEFVGDATWASAAALAREWRGGDPDGYRAEFIRLVELAASLETQKRATH